MITEIYVQIILINTQFHFTVPKGTLDKLDEDIGLDKKKTMDSEEISESLLPKETDDGDDDELELPK